MLFQCHLWHAMYVFCDNSKFISIQSIINTREKKIDVFPLPLPLMYKLLQHKKTNSLQIDIVAKHTYFTRVVGCGKFLTQLTKIPANDIMWSSCDFMQCERNPDTTSVSIQHSFQFYI